MLDISKGNTIDIIETATEAVKELIKEAPDDWAQQVGAKMGKKATTIKSYVSGERGKRNKNIVQVLFHLKPIVDDFRSVVLQLAGEAR